MARSNFAGVKKAASAFSALMAALMLLSSCGENKPSINSNEPPTNEQPGLPPLGLPPGPLTEGIPPPPVINSALTWDTIDLIVRINPRHPEDEQFTNDWRLIAHNIDDRARILGPSYFGEVGPDGTAALGLPAIMYELPLVISAYNEALPGISKRQNKRCHKCCPSHHRHRDGHRDGARADESGESAEGEEGSEGASEGASDAAEGSEGGEEGSEGEGSEAEDAGADSDEASIDGGHDHRDNHCECRCGRVQRQHDVCDEDICPDSINKCTCHEKEHKKCKCPGTGHRDDCRKKCKKHHHDHENRVQNCRQFSIFVPPYCYDKAVWMVGPVESAIWDYYRRAARHNGEAWNASQVDCGTWLADLQLLILTDRVSDELDREFVDGDRFFDPHALRLAFQENQQLLVPTRPPICMATNFHTGGTLREERPIDLPADLVPGSVFKVDGPDAPRNNPIIIGRNGIVDEICGVPFHGQMRVNNVHFDPTANFTLDSKDFIGTVSEQVNTLPLLDVSAFNVRLGNGRPLDNDVWTDACALTTMFQFTNKADNDRDLNPSTGTKFEHLFGEHHHSQAVVFDTSDGDRVVDDDDTWVIFHNLGAKRGEEKVIAVELLGHRSQDFRDALHISFDPLHDELFLGLRADYELERAGADGELAFFNYTISVWDGSTAHGRDLISNDIAACYEAADVWAREFFVTQDFHRVGESRNCCFDGKCTIDGIICPLRAAEFAVRSQCFSNSRANSRWQNDQSAFWNISSVKGAEPNLVVNPGWLGPNLDFNIFIQKFDEAVFKGPRTIIRTDCHGQLLTALPTLVEGDRVLLKAVDSCCQDYDLVIPCVPEFTGFAGLPGVPYIPQPIGPPPFPIAGPPPVLGPIGPGLISPPGPVVGPGGGPGPIGPGGLIGPGPGAIGTGPGAPLSSGPVGPIL